MLVIATADESHVPVNNVSGCIKAVIKSQALLNEIGDTNDDTNGTNIDEVTTTWSPKRGVNIWLVLVVVIARKKSIKVAVFIIVLTIDIGPVFVGIIGVT